VRPRQREIRLDVLANAVGEIFLLRVAPMFDQFDWDSPGANPDHARRAPHRARREAEAIGSGRGRGKGENAWRVRNPIEISARPLDIRIARPRNRRGGPVAWIVVGGFARHMRRNGLPAREFADEQGRGTAIGPAGLACGKADLRRDLPVAGTGARGRSACATQRPERQQGNRASRSHARPFQR